MAKVTGPVLSIDAKGTIGKTATFQRRPSGPIIHPYSKPGLRVKKGAVPSASQQAQRTVIGNLVAQWKAFEAVTKALWDTLAKQVNYIGTGYHYFIHLGGAYPSNYLLLETGDKLLLEDGSKILLE